MARKPQVEMLKKQKEAYGGELRKTRAGREGPRPLATKHTMHLVLRSSKAIGSWSFSLKENRKKIEAISKRFATKYRIQILSCGNAGNHLHFHIKLANRHTYAPFIRAITSAIATAMTGANRWNPLKKKFWDYRPFTKIVTTLRYLLNLRDYIQINELEGRGCERSEARFIINDAKINPWKYNTG